MQFDAVIFDWAGTMIDPGCKAPVLAFRRAFEADGLDADDVTIRKFMGLPKREHVIGMLEEPPIKAAFQARFGRDWAEADVARLYQATTDAMMGAVGDRCVPVPGAPETLQLLRDKGLRIGSTTGYPRAVMTGLIEMAKTIGINPDIVVCGDEVSDPRPGPGQIFEALKLMGGINPERTVKVDDTLAGLKAGHAAGCHTVVVTASGNPVSMDEVAPFIHADCASIADLPTLLKL